MKLLPRILQRMQVAPDVYQVGLPYLKKRHQAWHWVNKVFLCIMPDIQIHAGVGLSDIIKLLLIKNTAKGWPALNLPVTHFGCLPDQNRQCCY
jgi:hypothetical protein